MPVFSIDNVKMSGVSVAVPKMKIVNLENQNYSDDDIIKFITTTGVSEFRVAQTNITTSDLGFEAAKALIEEMNIEKSEFDVLVFISQSPDYFFIPNTAPILQNRLGLSKSCLCFDVPLGCSGYTYGISILSSYLQNKNFRRGLLICGDTSSKSINPLDKSAAMLFGDAASATIIEKTKDTNKIIFDLGTDGSGYNAIIIPEGGFRKQFNSETLIAKDYGDGIIRRGCDLHLDGMDVFSFGISETPKTVKAIYDYAGITNENVDYAIFHQANKMMNEMIRKKLKFEKEKVPYSLEKFGNTSSASIPVTMVTQLRNQLTFGLKRLLLCGFGVGLSWGTCFLQTENLCIPELIEL